MSYATPISYNKKIIKKHNFNLNYAPHLGMFKHHVGNDPIDQLNFMADIGFKAFEDNDMRNRDVSLQKKMSMPSCTCFVTTATWSKKALQKNKFMLGKRI